MDGFHTSWSCFFLFLTVSSLWVNIDGAPTTDIDVMVDDPSQTGCLYNNTLYGEGQTVATKEPCLNCSCKQGALRCHLQVCPYLQDLYPPPAGCILVERKNGCCPKLHCPTLPPGSNRLLRKDPSGQIAAWKTREDLRKRLVKQLSKNGTEKIGCIEAGTLYAEGSAMMTSSTCEYCFCLKGKQSCVKPRCARPVLEGCTPRFRDLACCPTHYDCDSADNDTSIATKTTASYLDAEDNAEVRGNDRVIGFSGIPTKHQQFPSSKPTIKKVKRRNAEESPIIKLDQLQEEVLVTTLGPDSLMEDNELSTVTEVVPPATDAKPLVELKTNEAAPSEPVVDQTTEEPLRDAVAAENAGEENRAAIPTAPETPNDQSSGQIKVESDEVAVPTTITPVEEVDETRRNPTEAAVEPTTSLAASTRSEPDVGQDLAVGEKDTDAEAAERAIEVSVSSSVSSVSHSVAEPSKKMNPPPPPPPQQSITPHSKVAASANSKLPAAHPSISTSAPAVHVPVSEDPFDYDYDNMELPPSLPNLEIIPFVAADARPNMGNLDDDERLNLGGIVEQRTPLSQMAPTADQSTHSDFCFVDGAFYSHGEVIKSQPNDNADQEQSNIIDNPCKLCRCMLGQIICHQTQCAPLPTGCRRVERPGFCCGQVMCNSGETDHESDRMDHANDEEPAVSLIKDKGDDSSVPTPPSLLAFSVTFPPRPSSTILPSPSPPTTSTPFTNRFSLKRTTTTRPKATGSNASSSSPVLRNKLSKPAVNNLVGAALPPGGLRIDSCNIYGQMYRVGRIIDELSGPCIECKCTEIGVNCVNLKC